MVAGPPLTLETDAQAQVAHTNSHIPKLLYRGLGRSSRTNQWSYANPSAHQNRSQRK